MSLSLSLSLSFAHTLTHTAALVRLYTCPRNHEKAKPLVDIIRDCFRLPCPYLSVSVCLCACRSLPLSPSLWGRTVIHVGVGLPSPLRALGARRAQRPLRLRQSHPPPAVPLARPSHGRPRPGHPPPVKYTAAQATRRGGSSCTRPLPTPRRPHQLVAPLSGTEKETDRETERERVCVAQANVSVLKVNMRHWLLQSV
jgi:hypothetical protein